VPAPSRQLFHTERACGTPCLKKLKGGKAWPAECQGRLKCYPGPLASVGGDSDRRRIWADTAMDMAATDAAGWGQLQIYLSERPLAQEEPTDSRERGAVSEVRMRRTGGNNFTRRGQPGRTKNFVKDWPTNSLAHAGTPCLKKLKGERPGLVSVKGQPCGPTRFLHVRDLGWRHA
jgi:hypothetical protein